MPAPVIAAGISAAPAAIAALKGGGDEQKQNMAAQTGLAQEQTALGRLLRGQSQKMFGMSAPAYNQGLSYFKTLVQGGPGALRQLMSSENTLTNQTYNSAKMGLDRAGVRGGVGDQMKAQLDRDRAAQTAGMVPGMRYGAAEKLMSGGMGGLSAAQGLGGSAVTGLGNAGLTYASMGNTYDAQSARNERNWGGMGDAIGRILLPYLLNYQGKGGAGGSTQAPAGGGTPYRYGGYVPRTLPR